jgi:hypothetical protein
LPQVDECFHDQVERLGVEAAEAFVNENHGPASASILNGITA